MSNTSSRGPAQRRATIAGLGMSAIGRSHHHSARELAIDAVDKALRECALQPTEVDGLLISSGVMGGLTLDLQVDLGFIDLHLATEVQAFGASAGVMIQLAGTAIEAGLAETVVCVWADDPLRDTATGAYGGTAHVSPWRTTMTEAGVRTPNERYALAAQRHMNTFGTTSDQLGHIAVSQREWAALNPLAQLRDTFSLDDYHNSRWIVEPFHLLDCCLVSNGAVAIVVTTKERAHDLPSAPVEVLGWGQCHPGLGLRRNDDLGIRSGAAVSGPAAMRMAGVSPNEIDVIELYDCYTFTVLLTLEDYGFCLKGEGGSYVSTPGRLGPSGTLKLNTGGGQLSSYYLWGMTPLSEAIMQARGSAGRRQVDKHETVLVSGNGGTFDFHSTLVLGRPNA